MSTITKYKKEKVLKGIVSILIFACFIPNMQAQETDVNTTIIKTRADMDWEELNKSIFRIYPSAEYNAAEKAGPFAYTIYIDKYNEKSMRLAEAFWNNYPHDKRHNQEALGMFFHPGAIPSFMAKNIPDSTRQALAAMPRKEYSQFMRALPLDLNAMEQWTKKGEAMVAEILASDKPIEDKEIAEWLLFGRDYQKASKYFWFVRDFAKTTETDYWDVVATQYWEFLRLRLDTHITKYADLPVIADRAKDFLSGLKARAPRLADSYWEELYQKHGHSEKEGIKALYKVASENVAAIEALKIVGLTEKPLEMAFTAMDGTKVDLSKMRGKVVLIDFWATYCAPCIKEMPHVKALYDKYHDQGFEVIGIAADDDGAKSRVLDILNMTKANWPQRLDKGSDASVSFIALYNITSFPTVWLLNKDGVIVDRNARGERLEPLIRNYLELEEK